MKRWLRLVVAGAGLGLSGCGPREAAPPVGPVVDEAAQRREELFGAEARDPAIAWRPSGLGVKILVPGEGTAPTPLDRVQVQYVGRLKDGKIFDDSRRRNKPSIFAVNRLITGWAAAMPSLKPGGKAVFFIPPSLGYGGMRSGDIPPVSGLIFEVELLAVNPAPPIKP
jgi:FKBP-type peptidyl-prolyl cis-trans isomerase